MLLRALVGAGLVATNLVGCSTAPNVRPEPAKLPDKSVTKPTTAAPASTAPAVPAKTAKQGGYYDKDGPPEEPPRDLTAIPDAQPKYEALRTAANRPYLLFGQLYTPMTQITPFKQSGIASWYGKQFHGRKTSTGELYDMFAMTAAHPTLPLPSYVRVTNTRNGKQVVVRVNDRGPFLQNRAIDMSYAAATRLDYIASGHTSVEIELLIPGDTITASTAAIADPLEALVKQSMTSSSVNVEPGETILPTASPSPTASTESVYLQLGAFTSRDAADNALRHAQRVLPEFENRLLLVDGKSLIRLRMGPFETPALATVAADQVAQSTGFKPVRVLQKR
jgi:rare lipoprotein A